VISGHLPGVVSVAEMNGQIQLSLKHDSCVAIFRHWLEVPLSNPTDLARFVVPKLHRIEIMQSKLLWVITAVRLLGSPSFAHAVAVPKLGSASAETFGGSALSVVSVSKQEDVAADSVATAFAQARDGAHQAKLVRIGINPFRENVCKHDDRFASGFLDSVQYKTSDPGQLPEIARQLAVRSDYGELVVARFGVGVCAAGQEASGKIDYSVLIVTYESRWNSFLRFWD
jgi:hypothetical protein